MKVNVWNTIQQLSKERDVDKQVIIDAIEESLRVAAANHFNENENAQIKFDPEKGELRVYAVKKITKKVTDPATEITLDQAKKIDVSAKQGNYIEIDLPSETLGRIAAQAAKQVIFQKVRDAEQEKIYNTFAPHIGNIITGVLRRFDSNQNMILEVKKTEVLLPDREKIPNEKFRRGDRVKGIIIQVLKDTKGPQVIISRTEKRFLAKLLENEVPEIANGNIEIREMVRRPGERSKVSVNTDEKDIDPIGACIGVKGNRILSISKELNGEKIDVIRWSENPEEYAMSALSPAKVEGMKITSQKDKVLKAIVPEDQLSLAIGKKGLNVRLASKLVGWKIDIKND
ncbi:MAG: transcription termination factor NusA [Candidatus Aminicenantes bacterium]|nr:transcription termination factor NusA [Candidatus Aminicenantes bacterium]